jgi:peptide/nickel transport system permease protein
MIAWLPTAGSRVVDLARGVAGAMTAILGMTAIVFVLLRVVPGDIIDQVASEGGFTTPMMEQMRRELGLDRPVWEQLLLWLMRVLQGDLGMSLRFQQPISDMLAGAVMPTVTLAIPAFAIGLLLGIALAVGAAAWPRSGLRSLVEAINIWSIAVPTFCVGLIGILVFVLWLRWTPLSGNIWLPALVIGIDIAGQLAKPLLEDLEEELGSPYVRTAAAKGVSRLAIVFRHVLPNAVSTLLALSGLVMGGLVGGTLTMEVLFGHAGLGKLALDAVLARDYPVTQAAVVMIATAVILINSLMTGLARVLDPRVDIASRRREKSHRH